MMKKLLCAAIVAFAIVAAVTADSATNDRGDRIAAALSAAQSSVEGAVSSGSVSSATRRAALRGMDVAKMTTRLSADSWEFGGRRLLAGGASNSRSDRISEALSASQESIGKSVLVGGRLDSTAAASRNGLAFAKLATKESADAWEFGGRKLLNGATNSRSDRISQALSASQESIGKSVLNGAGLDSTVTASRAGMVLAKLATKESADASEFGGRRLQSGATNSRSDRIAQALSASQESIGKSVLGGGSLDSTVAASRNGLVFAKLATKESADAWEFGGKRKLMDSATNTNSDRITQSINAAHEAVEHAVSGSSTAIRATNQNLAYSKLATKLSTDAWEFDSP